jgi:histidine triad (HIT) family protein
VSDALDAIRPAESLDAKSERLHREQAAEHGDCPFCQIIAGLAPATIVRRWPGALAIVPRGPVVDGHLLVLPFEHVADFSSAAYVSAMTMHRAAELAAESEQPMNLITSRGREASQSVFHLHLHLVPRAENDGLALPWWSGKSRRKDPHA